MQHLIANYALRALSAIIFASFIFTQWGFFWYATLLDDVWQSLIGKTELELIELSEQRGLIQLFNTYFISFVQVMGLFLIVHLFKIKRLKEFVGLSFLISLFFVVPALGNAVLFAGQPFNLWILDSLHFTLGYLLVSITLWVFLRVPSLRQKT